MKRIRVLHCPSMVAGNAQGLARAEREIGLDSWSIALRGNPYAFKADEILSRPDQSPLYSEMMRWPLISRALRNFDIIHFNFGQSIMPQYVPYTMDKFVRQLPRVVGSVVKSMYHAYAWVFEQRDLPLLKAAGKGILVTYQGNDARQGEYCKENFEINPVHDVPQGFYSLDSDNRKRKRISVFDRYADRIFSLNPDLMHVLPERTKFLPYSHIDLKSWSPVRSYQPNKVPIVMHAPTNREVKGTAIILDAIDRLKSEGIRFEFQLVEGLTHIEARKKYESADILIDQLLVGWYGGLAVELMALGKPVVSFIREEDLGYIPNKMREELPIVRATPSTLVSVLRELLATPAETLLELGRRSRVFVEDWHDPIKIAADMKVEYEEILR